MPWPVYSGQRTTCRNQLSPSTIFRENNPIPQNRVLTQAQGAGSLLLMKFLDHG